MIESATLDRYHTRRNLACPRHQVAPLSHDLLSILAPLFKDETNRAEIDGDSATHTAARGSIYPSPNSDKTVTNFESKLPPKVLSDMLAVPQDVHFEKVSPVHAGLLFAGSLTHAMIPMLYINCMP